MERRNSLKHSKNSKYFGDKDKTGANNRNEVTSQIKKSESPTFASPSKNADKKSKRQGESQKSRQLPPSAVKAFLTRCQEVERVCKNNIEKSPQIIFRIIENKFPDFLPELKQFYRKEKSKISIPVLKEVIRKTMDKELEDIKREGTIMKEVRSEKFAQVIDENFQCKTNEGSSAQDLQFSNQNNLKKKKGSPFKGRPDLVPFLKIKESAERNKESLSFNKTEFSKNKMIEKDLERQEKAKNKERTKKESKVINAYVTPELKEKFKSPQDLQVYKNKKKESDNNKDQFKQIKQNKDKKMGVLATVHENLKEDQNSDSIFTQSQKIPNEEKIKSERKEESIKNQKINQLFHEVNILKKRNHDIFSKYCILEKCFLKLKNDTRWYYSRMKEIKDEVILQRRFNSGILDLNPQIQRNAPLRDYFFTLYRRLAFIARALDIFRKNFVRVNMNLLEVNLFIMNLLK